MPIGHVGLVVSNLEEAKAFYLAALGPLGYEVVLSFPGVVGLGAKGDPDFWLSDSSACPEGARREVNKKVHIAFKAESREVVDKFHAAALAAGGKDNGAPGLRNYTPTYYAAFIHDAEGNNIEAVNM